MKRVLLLALLCPSLAFAWEIKDNPDRFPSVGFNYMQENLSGDLNYDHVVFLSQPQMKDKSNSFVADLRLPVSNFLTVEAGGGYANRRIDSIDGSLVSANTAVYDTTHSDMSGPIFKAGFRIYLGSGYSESRPARPAINEEPQHETTKPKQGVFDPGLR